MKHKIKRIPGLVGYAVSNYGEVYSYWKSSGVSCYIGRTPKKLKTTIIDDGREVVTLSVNKKRVSYKVCRLVLTAFNGLCPEGMEACHFPDRNPANNRLDNLRWDTKKSNYNDRRYHGTSNIGERNGSARLKRKDVIEIRKQREDGEKYRVLAEKYNVSLSTIQQLCERRTWKWL